MFPVCRTDQISFPLVWGFSDYNVRQGTLQKFLKISIKNSKCAVSNKHIRDGRSGRYENRTGSKIKAKHHQKTPPRNVNVRDVITHKARESGIVPADSKKTEFRQKSAKWDHCAPKMRNDDWPQRPNWRSTLNCYVIGAYPRALLPFTECLDDVWSTRSVF